MFPHDETTYEGMTQMLQEFMIKVIAFGEGEDGKSDFAELSRFQNRWFARVIDLALSILARFLNG